MANKLTVFLVALSLVLGLLPARASRSQTLLPPFAGTCLPDHHTESNQLFNGAGIDHGAMPGDSGFRFRCDAIATTARLSLHPEELVPYGHGALAVTDDYRIPVTVAATGAYSIAVDYTVDASVLAVSREAFATTTSAASNAELYVRLLTGAGVLVPNSAVESVSLWNDDFSTLEVLGQVGETTLEAVQTLAPPSGVIRAASFSVELASYHSFLLQLIPDTLTRDFVATLDSLALSAGEPYEISILTTSFCWAGAYGLGGISLNVTIGDVTINSIRIVRTDDPSAPAVTDAYEANDSWQSATPLGVVDSHVDLDYLTITGGDVDYFRFSLPYGGLVGDRLRILLQSELSGGIGSGDIDLALGRINNQGVFTSASGRGWNNAMSAGVGNVEEVTLQGRDPGDYVAIVFGGSGFDFSEDDLDDPDFSGSGEERTYFLEITGSDQYEDDDAPEASSTVVADGIQHQHTLPSNDTDWTSFTLEELSEVAVTLRAATFAELDFSLYGPDSAGALVASANLNGSEESEQIERSGSEGLEPGTYYVDVSSQFANDIARYSVSVAAPEPSAHVTGLVALAVLWALRSRRRQRSMPIPGVGCSVGSRFPVPEPREYPG